MKVYVASVKEVLEAGFVPAGCELRNEKTKAAIPQAQFDSLSGRVVEATETGNAEYPVTIGNLIMPAAFVFPEVRRTEIKTQGGLKREITLFSNGAALLWDQTILDKHEAAKLAGGASPEVN